MNRKKWGALLGAVSVALLAVGLLVAAPGEAQRRGARRGGEPFVRATAGNITINVPIQAAPADGAEATRQGLLGSAWSCSAAHASGTQIAVSCRAGQSAVSFTREACDPLTFALESNGAATYELSLGCE